MTALLEMDPAVAQQVLGDAADTLLPSPYPSRVSNKNPILENVFSEARQRLQLDPHDSSPRAFSRILELLTDEMQESALSEDDEKEARDRLGQTGLLRPNQYRIVFTRAFLDNSVKLGILRSNAGDAVRSPEYVSHLGTALYPSRNEKPISIYARASGTDSGNRYFLLVVSRREGGVQFVEQGWRVYTDAVDLSKTENAMDILVEFLKVYGMDLALDSNLPTRVIVEQALQDTKHFKLNVGLAGETRFGALCVYGGGKSGGVVHLAYKVDLDKYINSMRKHGVAVNWP